MSDLVVFIGDSYLDTGNLHQFIPQAFDDLPYNDGRPSDGIGLAEAIANGLEVDVDVDGLDQDSFFARLEILNPFFQPNLKAVTYATAGATLGENGAAFATVAGQPLINVLSQFPIGNQTQIETYLEDLESAHDVDEVTYVINGGNNEILELIGDPTFIPALLDPLDPSDKVLISDTVNEIVGTLTAQINDLDSGDSLISNVALLGVFPVGKAPLINQIANQIALGLLQPDDDIADLIANLSDFLTETFSGIAEVANDLLEQVIDGLNDDPSREGDFAFVDSFPIFDTLVNSNLFEETEISYLEYLASSGGSLSPDDFLFVDELHTTGRANELIGQMISEQLPGPIKLDKTRHAFYW